MKKEIWKDIVGFNGIYLVSNLGQVKTMKRNVFDKSGNLHYVQKERLMRSTTTHQGYKIVRLRTNSISRNYFVHRLVLIAFVTNLENKRDVNHKNGIKSDNYVENLEWCTRSENEKHAYRKLGKTSYFKDRFGKRNPRSIPIIQMDKNGNVIKRWESATVAERDGGFSSSSIRYCVNGKTRTSQGFKWEKDV